MIFILFFWKLAGKLQQTVESRCKPSGAVGFCCKTPRDGRISSQNTMGQSNLATKHQGTVGFHRKIQKPAKK
jgi:hypothetical protein